MCYALKGVMTTGTKLQALPDASHAKPESEVDMIAEKEQACTTDQTSSVAQSSLSEERRVRAERISQAIRDLPDYTKVDDTGFLRDLWDAFTDDTRRIWRERKTAASSKPRP